MPKPMSQEQVDKINHAAIEYHKARSEAWNEWVKAAGDALDEVLIREFNEADKSVELKALQELAEELDLLVMDVGRIWRKHVPF